MLIAMASTIAMGEPEKQAESIIVCYFFLWPLVMCKYFIIVAVRHSSQTSMWIVQQVSDNKSTISILAFK